MFNQVCTLYSKLEGDRWHGTVLEGVYFCPAKGFAPGRPGPSESDRTILMIPFREGYLPPKQWRQAPDTGWTIQPGDKVVMEATDYEIKTSASELTRQFDQVFTVQTVESNLYGSKLDHWAVNCV